MTRPPEREHGGGLDAARARWGGARSDWIDLSTGINPEPYPLPDLPADAWTALPDRAARDRLEAAARAFWAVPDGAGLVAAPGASSLIARLPALAPPGRVRIALPTYNEHAAAFEMAGWTQGEGPVDAAIVVHPNNPDGRHHPLPCAPLAVVDESFCDTAPDASHVGSAARTGVVVLKSFGKFWGLAGLRLGFAVGDPALIDRLAALLGPWPVPGPALAVGAAALEDHAWAEAARARLARDAARLDAMLAPHARVVGGTTLFRLYEPADAAALRDRLARARIWSRTFGYAQRWLRLGLPPAHAWDRLAEALG